MAKQTQAIVGNLPTNCLSVFDHFMGLALKGLNENYSNYFHHKTFAKF